EAHSSQLKTNSKNQHLTMAWFILVLAGLFEVAFTTCLKMSDNFKNTWWSIGFFISITLSFFLLNKAIQTIPLGTGYAVWTGIGAVGTAIIGIFIFKEPAYFWRVFFIMLLISSIVGLKLVSKEA
ncbi:MAG: multidrug efflux SMR transporter, partial [Chitinophagaceae bacterium]